MNVRHRSEPLLTWRAKPIMLRLDSSYSPAPVATAGPVERNSRVVVAAIAFAIAWILLLYGDTTRSIVSIWIRSPTFTHGFLVVPVVLALVWRRRRALATVAVKPCIPACGVLL